MLIPGAVLAQQTAVPTSTAEIQLSFAPVVKRVGPAVVNVYASRQVTQRQSISPFFDDPFFRRFFGDPRGAAPAPRQRIQQSLGSGVIISSEGIIVTNHHVIKDADAVRVALSDRREFDCDIILKDERTDLAVLKIRGDNGDFPFLSFADSDSLEVGDIVLAIGNPFGVGQTVTQGIVSALARTHVGVTDYQFFIQTDAAINPGNSGGALVDMRGNLVGINSAIYSRSGGSNGIGFAIPANMVRLIADSAQNGGIVKRPWLGAQLQAITADIAETMGMDRPRGVLVTSVLGNSPAARARLRRGDVILAVDGVDVDDPNAFGYRFATKGIGNQATFTILRGGRQLETRVDLMAAPETVPRETRTIGGYSPFAGATVSNLSPAVSEELGMDTDLTGVVITGVTPGSTANRVGLQVGDVVRAVNNDVIASTRELERISRLDERLWQLELLRDGRAIRFTLRG
ncbi:DegQ family serine endoprotease [Breoghania sp. L-A4]|uniref:DegQ family serine endoprotease n=1 Tax=Breoghania sp. L-A4 TaxID=2304600 RepID=UPI0020BD546E|nr:DegQ family serine endoprotease [Breoghania sp. L-A4]